MHNPVPGVDPYLAYSPLWPDLHNRPVVVTTDILVPLTVLELLFLEIPTPLLLQEEPAPLSLNQGFHDLHTCAYFDLQLDRDQSPMDEEYTSQVRMLPNTGATAS